MRSLKFKLYAHKRNRYLKRMVNAAGVIYSHAIALHKRYYRMWNKHLSCAKLQAHIAGLRSRNAFWQSIGSQAVQDICQRIEKAYQRNSISQFVAGVARLVMPRTTGMQMRQ